MEDIKNSEWYQQLKEHPVAYFCAEYALASDLPTYAGGLGILAGDFVRETADEDFPVIALGLYYHDGYETLQEVDARGYIDVPHVHTSPENFGLSPLLDTSGNRIIVEVTVQDRVVKAQIWRWQVKNVGVFLLDTDVEGNDPLDRKITDHLYVADKETRFKQEIMLGIGGHRLLEKLALTPSVYHMNEGHSAMLALEVINQEIKDHHVSFEEAIEVAKKKIVFTNHTLVVSGNDVFSNDLVSLLLSGFAQKNGIPVEKIVNLGLIQDSSAFSMTMLALRIAGKINAVSKLHSQKAAEMWRDHPMIPIVNGIHLPTWDRIGDEGQMWESHQANKRELLRKIKMFSGNSWDENTLLVGWARRMVEYKRPFALFEDLPRLKKLLTAEHGVRIIYSGRLHPSDKEGNQMLDKIEELFENELKGYAVYLPDYTFGNAQQLTSGCDVWLNTPIVGFEACGTSGMKAALNGNIPVTTKDGWVYEADLNNAGFILDSDHINASILQILEEKVVPTYYQNKQEWVEMMKNSRNLIKNNFSTRRMLKDYVEKMYR